MKKQIINLIILVMLLCGYAKAVDTRISCTQGSCTLTSKSSWASFNQVYLIRPLQPQNSIYFFIANRNPTTAHSITFSVYQTPANSIYDYSNNTGFWVKDSVNGNCTNIPANTMSACWVTTMFASQVAIVITGASAQTGSPDTGDIYINQGIGVPQGQGIGQSFANDSYIQSEQSSQITYSYALIGTNPTANYNLFTIASPGTKTVFFKNLYISTTASANIKISWTAILTGGNCTSAMASVYNTNLIAGSNPSAADVENCASPQSLTPAQSIFNITIPAGFTNILPLTDFYSSNKGTGYLYAYLVTGITATFNSVITWSEQ